MGRKARTLLRMDLFSNPPYMRAWDEIVEEGEGKVSRITFVETGAAVSVVPLQRDANGLHLTLINEFRSTGEQELKTIGSYRRHNENNEMCARRCLRSEAGIWVDSIMPLGRMVGFTVIKLPIHLFYTFGWSFEAVVQEGITIQEVGIDEAVDMVLANQVGDEAAAKSILLLSELERRGKLVP